MYSLNRPPYPKQKKDGPDGPPSALAGYHLILTEITNPSSS